MRQVERTVTALCSPVPNSYCPRRGLCFHGTLCSQGDAVPVPSPSSRGAAHPCFAIDSEANNDSGSEDPVPGIPLNQMQNKMRE